ncbi:MAG: excisionase family DNA-binding protein [Verrucomicrobiota bacterium]|nr:excisionase family DNA-binding protein [Verrucomicrobiota bacterium]
MKISESRVDPSELSESELDQLQPILDLAGQNKQPCLLAPDGTKLPLPEPIFNVLVTIVQGMRQGKTMMLCPEDETFTTQAAANFLGMSRQYFVTLLESGQIKFHRVGSHRRVYFKDLRNYMKLRDKDRRAGLSRLFKKLQDEKQYDTEVIIEDAQ